MAVNVPVDYDVSNKATIFSTAPFAVFLMFGMTVPASAQQDEKQQEKQNRPDRSGTQRPPEQRQRPPEQDQRRAEQTQQPRQDRQPIQQAPAQQDRQRQQPQPIQQAPQAQQQQRQRTPEQDQRRPEQAQQPRQDRQPIQQAPAQQQQRQQPQQDQRRPEQAQQPRQDRQPIQQAPQAQQDRQQEARRQNEQQRQQLQPQRSQQQAQAWQQQRGWQKQGGGWQGSNTWQQDRARNFAADHRSWAQRGGYGGYYVPQDRFNLYFGSQHYFRIRSRPVIYQGYPRFEYGGFAFLMVDPWPEYWFDNWYDANDLYIDYDDGYYLYNRSDPRDRLAITITL